MKLIILAVCLFGCANGDNVQLDVEYSTSVADDWQDDTFTWDGTFERVCYNNGVGTTEVSWDFQWVGSYYDVDAQAWDLVGACTGHRPASMPSCEVVKCQVMLSPEVE